MLCQVGEVAFFPINGLVLEDSSLRAEIS